MIGRGNRSIRRKPAPVPLCPPQTPHAARTRTRAATVGSQRLTAELRHGLRCCTEISRLPVMMELYTHSSMACWLFNQMRRRRNISVYTFHGYSGIVRQLGPRPLPSRSVLMYYLLMIASFDAINNLSSILSK
jgi:hypothetical protein